MWNICFSVLFKIFWVVLITKVLFSKWLEFFIPHLRKHRLSIKEAIWWCSGGLHRGRADPQKVWRVEVPVWRHLPWGLHLSVHPQVGQPLCQAAVDQLEPSPGELVHLCVCVDKAVAVTGVILGHRCVWAKHDFLNCLHWAEHVNIQVCSC